MVKLIALFSLAGFVIPILFSLIWWVLEQYPRAWLFIGGILVNVQLLVWPSSIFMMATAGHEGIDYGMLALAITVNIVLYASIGFLIWWGMYKQRWAIYCALGLILLIWYKLFIWLR